MSRILLVEDDPFLIDIYQKKLEEENFKVKVIKKGDKVIPKLKEKDFDLLLLDIVLPEIGGWEILRKMEDESLLNSLKIVILSNLGQKEEVEKGLKLGAEKYLIKANYTPSEVVKEIKKIL